MALFVVCICAASMAWAQNPPSSLEKLATEIIAEERENFSEWENAQLGAAYPLHRPDVKGVAYYEFAVVNGKTGDPAGFIVLSTGPHDYRIVEWSTKGKPNVEQLAERVGRARKQRLRYYRLDVASFAAEDKRGQLVGQLGDYPLGQKRSAWPRVKREFRVSNAEKTRQIQTDMAVDWKFPALQRSWCGDWKTYWAGTEDDQRNYYQIPSGTPPNNSGCFSGYGATAWAMLFGWVDYRASQNDSVWKASWGMYGGVADVAPQEMDAGMMDMTWEIRGYIKTECAGDQGRTWPWDMENAHKYLSPRTNSAVDLAVQYTTFGQPSDGLRDKADSIIRSDRPIVIGLGWEHYALAYGYRKKECRWGRDKHQYYINNGDGSTRRWTDAGTWFVGEVIPYASSPDLCPSGQRCCWGLPDGIRCGACRAPGDPCPPNPWAGCPANKKCCESEGDGCTLCVPKDADCP